MKIEVFPVQGSNTPSVLLASISEHIDDIKNLAVVIEWVDNKGTASWSSMSLAELCFLTATLQEEVRKAMYEEQK